MGSDPFSALLWDVQKNHISSESLFFHVSCDRVGEDYLYGYSDINFCDAYKKNDSVG